MKCPFDYQRRRSFSFGVASDFVDYVMEKEAIAEREYNQAYPTCWDKFMHWLGRR